VSFEAGNSITKGLVVTIYGTELAGPATIISIGCPGVISGTFLAPSGEFSRGPSGIFTFGSLVSSIDFVVYPAGFSYIGSRPSVYLILIGFASPSPTSL
jgi:hypothetical protein